MIINWSVENKNVTQLKMFSNEVEATAPLIVHCTAALTSLSDSVKLYSIFIFAMTYWLDIYLKVGSHDPILVQLLFQIFLCMMKNVGVHTIQFSHPIIS